MTMPKIVFSATGDEFFMPDDSHHFFKDLPEPKYMA
jgi:PhoPQ-activated pathogenicity-related protein